MGAEGQGGVLLRQLEKSSPSKDCHIRCGESRLGTRKQACHPPSAKGWGVGWEDAAQSRGWRVPCMAFYDLALEVP